MRRISRFDWVALAWAGTTPGLPRSRVQAPPIAIERALYEVGRPLFHAVGGTLTEQVLLRCYALTALVWNATFLEDEKDIRGFFSRRQLLEAEFGRGNVGPVGRRLAELLLTRRRQLFPADRRYVVEVTIRDMRPVVRVRGETPAPRPAAPAVERPAPARPARLRLLH